MTPPKKILVIRFSAMGDVMLLTPVLKSLTVAYPEVQITLVTRPRFASFFNNISGVKVFPADVDSRYNGFLGLRDLFKQLMKRDDYDLVIDLHDHIRTMMLRSFFKLFGKKVIVFKKGRKDKKALVRKDNKVVAKLPHTVERYHEAFERAGLVFPIIDHPYLIPEEDSKVVVNNWMKKKGLVKDKKWIGIAPFAMHTTKIYPVENYETIIQSLLEKQPFHFFFFGGEKEIDFFKTLSDKFPEHCTIVAGELKIKDEIALLPSIDVMVCMDSSNMHLAALVGVPLISIWGGTHPDTGFGPYGYRENSLIQIDREELTCRPCSVYGKETCFRGDFACMNRILPENVVERILMKVSKELS